MDKLGAAAKIAETLAANLQKQSSELLARSKRKTAALLTDARFTTGLGERLALGRENLNLPQLGNDLFGGRFLSWHVQLLRFEMIFLNHAGPEIAGQVSVCSPGFRGQVFVQYPRLEIPTVAKIEDSSNPSPRIPNTLTPVGILFQAIR